jgi:Na+/H+-dicarboxylate symporter
MATNEILQILVFSIFFGVALASLKDKPALTVTRFVDELGHAMLKLTEFVMMFAPVGRVRRHCRRHHHARHRHPRDLRQVHRDLLRKSWPFCGVVLIAAGFVFLRGRVFTLISMVREPMLIAFTTASSEAAYPKLMERLERFGAKERVTALVLPLGYSFNLDGSMVYQAFAALFIAQAYGIEMSIGQQMTMLLVMMLSSKGVAGVPRASLVVVAAVLPTFGLPEAGLLLIMGIDQFLDMGRTATNVIGNGIATAVVAKWEGELGPTTAEPEAEAPGEKPA